MNEKTILERAHQQQGPIPQRIQDAPDLEMGLEFTYQAFGKLTTCRSFGMGPGPIPWTAIDQYCSTYGVNGDHQEELEYLIERMDEAYLKYVNEKAEKQKTLTERSGLKGATTAKRR